MINPLKLALKWLREALDLDADLTVDDGVISVEITLKLRGAVLYTDHFEWTLPDGDGGPQQITGQLARRRRSVPQGA